jgi:CheY-like chemotaxis protein
MPSIALAKATRYWSLPAPIVSPPKGQTQHKRRALEAGFDRHFTKPLSSDALRKVVAEAPAHAAVPQAKREP